MPTSLATHRHDLEDEEAEVEVPFIRIGDPVAEDFPLVFAHGAVWGCHRPRHLTEQLKNLPG